MSDLPVPSAGGCYLRNDETGELTLDVGPAAPVELPAVPVPEAEAPEAPETPSEET